MNKIETKTALPLAGAVLAMMLLSGCAETPTGPTVAVMPAPGKPMDLFENEDAECRQYSQQAIAGAENPNNKTAVGAGAGTVIGAAAGAVLGGRNGAGAGAATGLLFGTAAGSGAAEQSSMSLQRRYNIAYEQCMYSKGNQIPAYGYSSYAYPPPPRYAPPPPPGSPPPPPR